MSDAIAGLGATFERGDGATSELFTAIAEVLNITGPGLTRDFIDVTNLSSSGGYREFVASFRDGGEYTFTCNFVRAEYDLLLADFENDSAVNYQVVLPDTDTTTIQFTGLLTALPMTVPFDDKVTVDVTIKITGGITIPT